MHKILYVAPFLDGTGYSTAAIETVAAMVSVGLDVVCKPVRFNDRNVKVPQWLIDLFNKSATDCDVCVQHVLPSQLDCNKLIKRTIPFFALETNELEPSWKKYLRNFNEVWAINNHMKRVLKRELPGVSCTVINHPINVNYTYDINTVVDLSNKVTPFTFYTIGEFVCRKNYEGLLRAYLSEFSEFDNVQLTIKSSKDGWPAEETKNRIEELISHVKTNLKLNYYPKVNIITEYMDRDSMIRLHLDSDCFVQPSHGEAFSIPAAEALAFGKTPIVSKCTGYLDYVLPSTGFLIDGDIVPCYGALDTFKELYTARQTWFEPNILKLREAMREVYSNEKNVLTHKRKRCIKAIEKLSYLNVGSIIKSAIENPD